MYEQMTDLPTAKEGAMYLLQSVLLKTLADGYVEKLNQQKTPEKRLTFLVKNERVLNALFCDAEAFVRENREKYAENAEVFKKAIRGGIIRDFNKYMMERQMDIAKQNTGKAKQALADSLTRTEQQPKKEAPVIGGGLK